jgi:hypothetical protein
MWMAGSSITVQTRPERSWATRPGSSTRFSRNTWDCSNWPAAWQEISYHRVNLMESAATIKRHCLSLLTSPNIGLRLKFVHRGVTRNENEPYPRICLTDRVRTDSAMSEWHVRLQPARSFERKKRRNHQIRDAAARWFTKSGSASTCAWKLLLEFPAGRDIGVPDPSRIVSHHRVVRPGDGRSPQLRGGLDQSIGEPCDAHQNGRRPRPRHKRPDPVQGNERGTERTRVPRPIDLRSLRALTSAADVTVRSNRPRGFRRSFLKDP